MTKEQLMINTEPCYLNWRRFKLLGAILGDIIGSPYEFSSGKRKEFSLFTCGSRLTDDSLMTIAIGCACVNASIYDEDDFKSKVAYYMRLIGRQYPDAGYGAKFYRWLFDDNMGAYNSFGNGSGMRVSPVAYVGTTLEDVERLAKWSAEVTHNSADGICGAQAIASAIFLARTGKSKDEIREYIGENFYNLDFTLDYIRPFYSFDVTCKGSVPQAIVCFLEAESYEDAVRNAISLGGDCDTIGAMAGAIAEAYFGIPENLQEKAFEYMDEQIQEYYYEYADQLYR